MALLKQSTARNREVLMTDSADHITGKTGLTLTITASKDGGAFASITPTVTELSAGWYSIALTTTHTNTLGDLALHITGSGADPTDTYDQVVVDLPGAAVTVGTNNDKTGYSLSSAGIQAIWDALTSALTTVNSIGKLLASNVVASVTGAVGSVAGNVVGSVGSVVSGVTVTTNNDKAGYALTAGEHTLIAADVLDAAQSGHNTAGTIGNKIGAAASAGDPWATSVPGSYGNGTAGKILGTNLDAVLSAVKAKTDGLNFTGANVQSTPQTNVNLNMAQAVPTSNTAQTVGDSLNAARAQGFGRWTISGTQVTLFAGDSSTVVRQFTLDSATNPTSRT